jgi:anti-sigma regulatory factor (Ser/Thr protein kinase)
MIREMPSSDTGFSAAPLRIKPEIGELDALIGFIEEFARCHGWAAADTHAFSLAAEELFANTVGHSLDPTAHAEVDTTLPVEQRQIGGLGIHFIRRTMQTFTYQRVGERNVVCFGRPLTRLPG